MDKVESHYRNNFATQGGSYAGQSPERRGRGFTDATPQSMAAYQPPAL